MLTKIKDRASGWIAWAIVILISIPFALWGINSYFEGASKVVIATADKIEIEKQYYQEVLAQRKRSLIQMAGSDFDPEFFSSQEFKRGVLDQLIDETLQGRYIRSRRYSISDEELNQQIRSIPAFLNDGMFDSERYHALVGRAGFSVVGFEEQQRQQAAFSQLESIIVATAFALESRTDHLLELLDQKRDARYVVFDMNDYLDKAIVSDEVIEDRYREYSDRYYLPAEIQVDYLILSVDSIARDIMIDDQEIRAIYAEDPDRFRQAERRSVRHILISIDGDDETVDVEQAEIVASDLATRARQGEDFSKLAEQFSDDAGSARRGGDLGVIQPGAMPPLFEKTVDSMFEGEISEPVRTPYGFHVIQVTKLIPETIESYEDVRDRIAQEIKRREAEAQFVELGEDLRNLSYEASGSLQLVADNLKLDIVRSNWFSEGGGDGIADSQTLREAVFTDEVLVDGLNSEVVEIDVDTLVVARKANYRERRKQPLSEAKEQIVKDSRLKITSDLIEAQGEAFVSGLRNKKTTWTQEIDGNGWQGNILPSTSVEIGDEFLLSVQSMINLASPPGESGQPVYGSGWIDLNRFVVYELSRVEGADPSAASEEDRLRIEGYILRQESTDLHSSFKQHLRDIADVEVRDNEL